MYVCLCVYIYIYITFSLSIHPLKECSIHWKIISVSWLLWIMLQWIWESRYSFEILILYLSAIYPGVELLCYIAVLLLILWGTTILFSKVVIPRSNVFFNTSARCITHRTELEWGIKHHLHKHSSLPIWILYYFSTKLLLPLLSKKRLLGQSTIASTTYHASQRNGSTSDSSFWLQIRITWATFKIPIPRVSSRDSDSESMGWCSQFCNFTGCSR